MDRKRALVTSKCLVQQAKASARFISSYALLRLSAEVRAAVAPGICPAWVDGHCPVETRKGIVRPTDALESNSEVVNGRRESRVRHYGSAEDVYGFGVLPQLGQPLAHLVQRDRIIRIAIKRGAVRRKGIGIQLLLGKTNASRAPSTDVALVYFQNGIKRVQSLGVLLGLKIVYSPLILNVYIGWRLREDSVSESIGLSEPAFGHQAVELQTASNSAACLIAITHRHVKYGACDQRL